MRYCFLFLILLGQLHLFAQDYHAVNGSMYAGSLGTSANPASIVHVPFGWDVTPLAFQFKNSTNAFRILNYALLSSPGNADGEGINGTRKRHFFFNQDLRLLNARINLTTRSAIAFGATLRNYISATTSNANWQDSLFSLADFLVINTGNLPLQADLNASSWAELYGSYAQTIFTDGDRIVNAGVTVKYNKSIAGGFARANGVTYIPFTADKPAFEVTGGTLQYGYSANIDRVNSNQTFTENRRALLQGGAGSLSADFGLEYLMLADDGLNEDRELPDEYSYITKIGVALLDLGSNGYAFSNRSRTAVAGKIGISDTLLEEKFNAVETADQFNDSLATVAASISRFSGSFYMYQPTRLVINVDQHLTGNFYVNASATIPVVPLVSKNTLYLRELNLLSITPRWETKRFGAYLPVLFNSRKQLWVGGAVKLGPMLFGIHNLRNLVSKTSMQNGGFYLAFTIRPGKAYDRQQHMPGGGLSGKEKRRLGCPSF